MLSFRLTLKVACIALLLPWSSGREPVDSESDVVGLLQHFSHVDKGLQRDVDVASDKGSKTRIRRGSKDAADLVIVGIGDSGTRGVKDSMEFLGMKFSPNQDLYGSGDSQDCTPNDKFSPYLLVAAGGRISPEGYKSNPLLWNMATDSIRTSLHEGFRHIVENSTDLTMDSEIIWGLKSPGQYYLLPGYDTVTSNTTKFLFVARDPRDLCTHEPDGLHNATEKMIQWFGIYQAGTENGTDCYGYWASSLEDTLNIYETESRFKVVRIEDLVAPDPRVDSTSVNILKKLADFVGLPRPTDEDAANFLLAHMHPYNTSYQGYHYDMTDQNRTEKQVEFAKHAMEHPRELVLMNKLGYRMQTYGRDDLGTPASPAVLRG